MASPDRLERLTDLVLVLLGTARPLSLDEIAREVPGYPEAHVARRQAFERDKRLLRDESIPVITEPIEGPEQFGYRIDPAHYYLPDLDLTPDEQAALNLAVAGVHLGEPSADDALATIGASGSAPRAPLAWLEPPPALAALFGATSRQAEVAFSHRGRRRRVAPAGIWFRRGRWYLVGWDRDRDALRTFRVDRIEGPVAAGAAGSGVVPAGADPAEALPGQPWQIGEGEEEVVVLRVDPIEAGRVEDELGSGAVVERHPDGSLVATVRASNAEALRTWVLGLLDHVEVVGPPAVRASIVTWLEAIVAAGSAPAGRPAVRRADPAPEPDAEAGSARRPPPAVARRLRRLLAIVGWLARQGEVPLAEVAERFSIPEDALVSELELAACCGVPPYTPDTLMEIVVTGATVQAFLPADLARPRRLSVREAFSLIAAARTLLAVPGSDPDGVLEGAVGKLERVAGEQRALAVDIEEPPLLDVVREAVASGTALEIGYHSGSRDETTERVVEPVRVAALEGHWYLDAYCHRAGGTRHFRVDRIRWARPAPDPGPEGRPVPIDLEAVRAEPAAAFLPGPEVEEATVLVGAEAGWVLEELPVVSASSTTGGDHLVHVLVGGRAWLERLLLQLGPHARVLEPEHLVDAGARAAGRVLERYAGATEAAAP